jgi:hypothetical protein
MKCLCINLHADVRRIQVTKRNCLLIGVILAPILAIYGMLAREMSIYPSWMIIAACSDL